MGYKFTQKEFNDIVKTQEKYYPSSVYYVGRDSKTDFSEALSSINLNLASFLDNIVDDNIYDKVIALANPYTRDLVKNDLVETEDKFLFTKIKDVHGEILNLNKLDDDTRIYIDEDDPTPLTIKQVEDYGFDLDKFTKIPCKPNELEEDLPF